MKKRGFTLVELLAVIAILAILVIMALPAVLRMFNNARKDSFTNEVNTVIRTARQQYLLSGGSDTAWSNAEGSSKSLDLTGNSQLKYYIKMNAEGKIIKLQVTNGDFQYNVTNNLGIDIAESSDVQAVSDLNQSDIIVINENTLHNYIYSGNGTRYTLGSPIPEGANPRSNYSDAIRDSGENVFLRHTVEDGIVTESYVGFVINGNVYYLKGYDPDAYEDNKAVLDTARSNIPNNAGRCYDHTTSYTLDTGGSRVLYATAGQPGYVYATVGGWTCDVYEVARYACCKIDN